MRKDAALAVLLSADKQQVLLIKRRDMPIWVLPGGGIEVGETPEEAIMREVWEETGLRVKVNRKIAFYMPLNKLAKPTHLFICEKIDGMLRISCESQEIAYFDVRRLPKTFFIVHQDWLKDALAHQGHIPLNKPITRVTYVEFCKYICKHPCQVVKFLLNKD